MMEGKTRAWLMKRGGRCAKAGFINGVLSWRNGTKCFFYWFDANGDLQVTRVPVSQVRLEKQEVLQLEG